MCSILNDNWDVIFDFMIYSEDQFKKRYIKFLSSCKQYFFISSQRVYAEPDDEGYVNENTRRKVDCTDDYDRWCMDKYGIHKGLEENILFNSELKNWTILRLSMTFSTNRFQFGPLDNFDIVRAVRKQCTALSDSLADRYTTLTYGKDTANLIVPLVMNKEAINNVYNVGSNKYYTWREIADIYHNVFDLNYKIIKESDYLLATKSEVNMIDRRLDRKIDCSKLFRVGSNVNYSCMSLEEGLNEAWNNSDKDRYYNGTGKLDSHALIDLYTNTKTNIDNLHESIREKYGILLKRMNSIVKNPISMNDVFFVTEKDNFWNIFKIADSVIVERKENAILDVESKWCSFYPKFELKAGKKYIFSIEMLSNQHVQFVVFLHGYARNHEALCKLPLESGYNKFTFSFIPKITHRFLAVTALDFKALNIRLQVLDLHIDECLQ